MVLKSSTISSAFLKLRFCNQRYLQDIVTPIAMLRYLNYHILLVNHPSTAHSLSDHFLRMASWQHIRERLIRTNQIVLYRHMVLNL